ncbi:NUDIX hydrolase [Maritalea mediterranea]|uniref:NUDIX domain-containing protein n=1 Tax=Maritalea mediterranea TaxID=2909667 RepID=A0ABS9E4S2_9HYPH|nr:NUDIX domain-containing protein [Maritalea mediterranea]MCF4097870.1 NUDIX domain-containing protein [Maritalea mediterranea]
MSAQVDVVSAALFEGDQVLLVQRKNAPYQHYWSLPGGRIKAGETAHAAIHREIEEETGLKVPHFLAVQKHKSAGFTLQVFAATAPIAEATALDDAAAVRQISLKQIPDLPYTPDLWPIIRAAHHRLIT